jgi:ribose/xylose/arabinose/galactoside ABC-type transport system permease subunit
MTEITASIAPRALPAKGSWFKTVFVRLGVLPFLLVAAVVSFTLMSDNFFTSRNLMNVARQSTYLTLVALGQMVPLLTGGLDLSVGTTVALTSVVSALAMAALNLLYPDLIWLVIAGGLAAGLFAGLSLSLINGIGVAVFSVSPFMMTMGMTSVGFGAALYLTSGAPVYGMPEAFGAIFGYGTAFGIPIPIYVTCVLIAVMYIILNRTYFGRYFYAVGGNMKAARLSGIHVGRTLFGAYMLCGALTAISGLLLTARLASGEANIGATMPLEAIAACVIGGVSLSGGAGTVGGVVLGAIFIGLVQNGMNLARVESYLQIVVIGALLIFAMITDRIRQRIIAELGE